MGTRADGVRTRARYTFSHILSLTHPLTLFLSLTHPLTLFLSRSHTFLLHTTEHGSFHSSGHDHSLTYTPGSSTSILYDHSSIIRKTTMPISYPVPDTYDSMGRLRFDPHHHHHQQQSDNHNNVTRMMQMMQSHGNGHGPYSSPQRGHSSGYRSGVSNDPYRVSSPLYRSVSPSGKKLYNVNIPTLSLTSPQSNSNLTLT